MASAWATDLLLRGALRSAHRTTARWAALLVALALVLTASVARAEPQDLKLSLYESSADWVFDGRADLDRQPGLLPVEALAQTGGRFWMQADLHIPISGRWVIDFKNSSIIASFEHFLFDEQGRPIAHARGGIVSTERGPFMLRHGREFDLQAGRYRLITLLDSPSFLAQPRPYLDSLSHYRQAIKWGNALALLAMGVFTGLGIYYAAMSMAQERLAYGMYAIFILGNLLFTGASLLIFSDVLGPHSFYLVGTPILFSNAAYVLFVLSLLSIRRGTHPRLWRVGMSVLGVQLVLATLGLAKPDWALELDRWGVAVFMLFGLSSGVLRAWEGDASARRYLIANLAFFVPALVAISTFDIVGVYSLYIEHIGMMAVALEVVMLALVLSYQLGQVHRERSAALAHADENLRIARTDPLTGAPNRFALNGALATLPAQGCLTFVDLDGLKHYNDAFGHDRGDELLQSFVRHWRDALGERATVHRLGGDEFAVTCSEGDGGFVEQTLAQAIARVRESGFELAGASHGTAWAHERGEPSRLKQLADVRMYEHKRARRAVARPPIPHNDHVPTLEG